MTNEWFTNQSSCLFISVAFARTWSLHSQVIPVAELRAVLEERGLPDLQGEPTHIDIITYICVYISGTWIDNPTFCLPLSVKPKAEVHMAVAPPVMATVEALPSQGGEQQVLSSNAQHLAQAIPTLLATPGPVPPSQPSTVLSALPAAMAVTPPVAASMANTVASPTQPAASSTAACAPTSTCPDLKIKQEVETMDTSQPGEEYLGLRSLFES